MHTRKLRAHLLHLLPAGWILACTAGPAPGAVPDTTGSTGSSGAEEPSPTDPTSTGDALTTTSTAEGSTSGASGASSGEPGSSGSSGSTMMCGDGVVDEGEECDEGAENRDEGACTLDCKAAVCGDGLVWEGTEACDDAADNGKAYNGCSDICERNPYCGDSQVDVQYENCDMGGMNGSGQGEGNQAPCSTGCTWEGRVAFMTSAVYTGDLGGLDGADVLCQEHAGAAGMVRWDMFRAWLSGDALGPLDRFTAIPVRPILLPNGELIADSLNDLVLGGPGEGIRVDEFGAPLPSSLVWTNTGINGEPFSAVNDCSGWSSAMPGLSAVAGISHVPHEPEDAWEQWQGERHWTEKLGRACNLLARLYCFEQ